jgi:hypothetical protein
VRFRLLSQTRYVPVGGTAMGVVYPIWEALLCCGMCIGGESEGMDRDVR